MKVACLLTFGNRRYRLIADAMAKGIMRCGDQAVLSPVAATPNADVAVIYGWKYHAHLKGYPRFVYADLGFWQRADYYRVTAGGWGPESYVHAGLSSERLRSFGVEVQPWNEAGSVILLVGSSRKSAHHHGFDYMQWERQAAQRLKDAGHRVVYRPKPSDKERQPIPGVGYDESPLEESLSRAAAVVTHHSNVAVQALAAGVPVHCVTGAAAAFSVPMDRLTERREGREQFLADVAWLQWSLEEMRSGACWAHLKERGLC